MRLLFSPCFGDDLDQIVSYLSLFQDSPAAIERVVSTIFSSIDALKSNPWLGAELSAFFAIENMPFRRLVVGSCVVIYRVKEEAIIVERVFHEKRDYISILFP